MKKKKIIIGICVLVIVILAIIGIIVLKSVSTVEGNEVEQNVQSENNANTVSNVENTATQSIETEEIKFDEEDLKEKIGVYLTYENFMQDFYVQNQEDENVNIVDYANEAKVLIGYNLVVNKNRNMESELSPTEEQVRKAVEEYCGEHYEKYIDTAECWIAFDGNNAYEFVEAGDYTATGYCNEIEKIEETEDGKYTVTFVYSRPSESDYMDGTLDQVQKYRKQFTFIYHPDAQYTKYQLVELSFLKGENI